MKKVLTSYSFVFLLTCTFQGYSQLNTIQFSQLDSLQKVAPRPTLIFIHTDWCKFCAAMENTTFTNNEVIQVLNESYYFIEFNAESKKDINIKGNTYRFQPSGNNAGVHELAQELGQIDGALSYPTLCFLNHKYEIIFQYNQFMSSHDLTLALKELLKNP